MGMNSFTFTGYVARDAEQRFMANGDSIVSFTVPVDSGFGEKKKTAWVRCNMFGKRGDSVFPYLKKGAQVGVIGELSMNDWTNKDGITKTSPEVRVNELQLLGKPTGADQAPPEK